MLLTCTLPSHRNALAEQIYALIRSFVPNNPSKLSKGYSALSISTLCHYSGLYRFSIKLGSTSNLLAKKKLQPLVFINVIHTLAVACYSLLPAPRSP